uniref:Glycoside hydrolase family 3 N-terminal domain-containing protein n=1 Tax=Populus alba TaxID=43335 RepID=A0A4U5QZ96_POPAL|nr:hypothetical protein D5086_0000021140 [Populus alba]
MTLDEKVRQLGDKAIGVPRIGLPHYEWWSEAQHGVSNVGPGTFFDELIPGATSFPTAIHTTASFNKSLRKTIGQAVSTEARAMYNLGRAGLTYWSPNINVVRDPRWGRIAETPGEDPFVVGTYASNYVRGLQDVEGAGETKDLDSRPLKVSACCKRYTADDVDAWLGIDRYHYDARMVMLVVLCAPTTVLMAFLATCADPRLLKDTIRGEWDLHGYMLHQLPRLDLDCGAYCPDSLQNAVMQGEVAETEIDKSLKYLYVVLMRLGFFDGSPSFKSLG